MKAAGFVCLFILGVLLSVTLAGCGGGGTNQASVPAESQASASPSTQNAGEQSAEPSNVPPKETSLNIVDMPSQVVITEEEAQQGSEPPDAVPDDIPILDNAQNKAALKLGEGINPGEPYYQVSFQVDESVKKTGERYRQILKDNGLDIADESDEDVVQTIKVDTKSWDVTILIMKFLDHTNVSINYAKK